MPGPPPRRVRSSRRHAGWSVSGSTYLARQVVRVGSGGSGAAISIPWRAVYRLYGLYLGDPGVSMPWIQRGSGARHFWPEVEQLLTSWRRIDGLFFKIRKKHDRSHTKQQG